MHKADLKSKKIQKPNTPRNSDLKNLSNNMFLFHFFKDYITHFLHEDRERKLLSHSSALVRYYRAKWISLNAIKNNATQKQEELEMLIKILRRRKLLTILEIGSGRGGTLYVWMQVAEKNATVITLDKKIVIQTKKIIKEKHRNQNIHLVEKDSHLKNTKLFIQSIIKNKKIDLLFIDGDHTYKGVKNDWDLYSPLVKKGGLIVFHDINKHDKKSCKVEKFWQQIKQHHSHLEICLDINNDRGWGKWGGIGVIYK